MGELTKRDKAFAKFLEAESRYLALILNDNSIKTVELEWIARRKQLNKRRKHG